MSILEVTNLRFNYRDNELYNNVEMRLLADDHMGLVGVNGCGKTTFMNLIARKIDPDQGNISWLNGVTFSYLDQHLKIFDDYSISEYLYKVYDNLFEAEERMNKLYQSLEKVSESEYDKILNQAYNIQTFLEENDFYMVKSKIGNVINGLGINYDNNWLLKNLSSGQRGKIFLAKMLLEEKDVLLLDEPTNFLDVVHIEWLSKYLVNYKRAFIVISHNTSFLNGVCNTICELNNKTLTRYKGNYDSYLSQKAVRDSQYIASYEAQKRYIKKTQEFIDKNIARASTTKRAQSRQKQLDRIEVLSKPHVDKRVRFDFVFTNSFNSDAIRVKNLEIGYSFPILPKLNYKIRFGERVVIVGKNGIGKSTFLKTILNVIPAINGEVWLNPVNKITYYSQELSEIPTETAYEFIKEQYPMMEDGKIRTLLGKYGITGELAIKPMNQLSGGELTKVRFARLNLESSNLLILDEPTNHLDKVAKLALFKALDMYSGTIILVSHEKEFYEKLKMRELKFE